MSLSLRLAAIEIPEEILVEILVRLPADSLMRFKLVSRVWSSLISSRYFTNLFFKYSSSTNPKHRVFVHWNHRELFGELFSSSLCNLDATPSFLQLNPDLTLHGNRMQNGDDFGFSDLHFVNAMRGLMCFRDKRVVRIINFTTRQILTLPQVESNILMKSDDEMVSHSMWNYLGYHHVNDEYKVLSTISNQDTNEVRSETQVFVLGDGGASWRNTKSLTFSPPPHHPLEGGISINRVLYYGALSYGDRSVLMSFDFSSEEFNSIELPMEYRIKVSEWGVSYYLLVDLMNYQDQVAVFKCPGLYNESILDVWVLEEDAGQSIWSHKTFSLPYHELRTMLDTYIVIRGTGRSGEIALRSRYGDRREIKYIIYDLERNHITRVVAVNSSYIPKVGFEMNIWEDVESIMYLEPMKNFNL